MQQSTQPWWQSDLYTDEVPVPESLTEAAGPQGVALVRAWPDGRTDKGWGLQGPKDQPERGFYPRYIDREFNPRSVLYGFHKRKWNFAIVMRSVRAVCIDIDGKNGGLEHAKRLGLLPYTLAETSKSGDGFHLLYRVEDQWEDEVGFGKYSDFIGIELGVDIRSVGCVYHYPQQRWNHRPLAMLPDHLSELLLRKRQVQATNQERVSKILSTGDEVEVLLMQHELEKDLARDVPAGKRNTTLFAIGQKMKEAGVESWESKISKRADALGLDIDESNKLVNNIRTYN